MASRRPTVVVPLDGSALADAALGHAGWIARRLEADVLLLTVPWDDEDAARAVLLRAIGDEGLRGLSVDSLVADGDRRHPQEAVLTAAHDRPASLVVMGTRGRGTVQRAVLGSVAEAVVAALQRPVVLVGPSCLPAPDPSAETGPAELLVATDGSRLSLAGVEQLAPWAGMLGLTPTLVQVSAAGGPLWAADPVGLQILVDRAWPNRAGASWEILHGDDPAAALASRAAQGGAAGRCALLALTTHGASGAARVALGSVTADVAHRATVPVLTVRPDGVHGWWDRRSP